MATITEDYCSYEVAKLLKEKGFDIPSIGRYSIRSKEFHLDCTRMCNNGGLFECATPTLQMAMKWLREVHDIYIMIDKDFVTENGWHYVVVRKHDWADNINKGLIQQESNSYAYEFACEAAIKYCLENLI